jgi:rod shape-determining protein MreB and related proteins
VATNLINIFNNISSFFATDLAVDLGTINTRIYSPERGIILDEPSAIAINKFTGEIQYVGEQAYKLFGREPHDTEVCRPIYNGMIDNVDLTQKMLATFINRAYEGNNHRSHLVIGVAGSSTMIEQRSVRRAALETQATRVDLVDEGLAAALGAGIAFDDEYAHLIVDIGGGTTNITIVSLAAVVLSKSLKEGGNAMDHTIREYVRNQYEMHIGDRVAEDIKRTLGAAGNVGDENKQEMEIVGKHVTDGQVKKAMVGAVEICQAIEPVIKEINMGIRRTIEDSQPDVTADIYRSGIILTGGGALLPGIVAYLQSELDLKVTIADEPQLAVVRGVGRLLTNREQLRRVAIREDAPVWQVSEELIAQ